VQQDDGPVSYQDWDVYQVRHTGLQGMSQCLEALDGQLDPRASGWIGARLECAQKRTGSDIPETVAQLF
jgi:hypothetical protein